MKKPALPLHDLRHSFAAPGVGAASVSRWRALAEERGAPIAKPRGGDRRSSRIEAEAELIYQLLRESPDITIEELRAALAARNKSFGYGTARRFFARHRITRKKDRPCERAGQARRPEEAARLVRRAA